MKPLRMTRAPCEPRKRSENGTKYKVPVAPATDRDDLPLRLDHVLEFKFNVRIDGLHILVQSVKKRDTCWDCHSFDILVTYVINVFHQGANGVGMRNNHTPITCSNRRDDNRVEKRHDPIGGIFERFGSGCLQLLR